MDKTQEVAAEEAGMGAEVVKTILLQVVVAQAI
jgi:hypothetical protein